MAEASSLKRVRFWPIVLLWSHASMAGPWRSTIETPASNAGRNQSDRIGLAEEGSEIWLSTTRDRKINWFHAAFSNGGMGSNIQAK
mgnify:CR=1 FL=1